MFFLFCFLLSSYFFFEFSVCLFGILRGKNECEDAEKESFFLFLFFFQKQYDAVLKELECLLSPEGFPMIG